MKAAVGQPLPPSIFTAVTFTAVNFEYPEKPFMPDRRRMFIKLEHEVPVSSTSP
jgi:hypothetical protein